MNDIVQLNADLLDVEELERRIETSQIVPLMDPSGASNDCTVECNCVCTRLNSCETFCV